MAEERSIRTSPGQDAVPLGPRLVGTDMFRTVFDTGMALVEETADYLDGDGRKDSLRLTRAGAMAYASESMRLTTRLMQVASWLLLQRGRQQRRDLKRAGAGGKEQGAAERPRLRHARAGLGRAARAAPLADRSLPRAPGTGGAP
jgi:regulator of CtrA degradation